MKVDKLGDCLSYGLVHELMDVKNNSKKVYLKSAYIFMYLNDLLGITAVRKLKNITDKKADNREQCEELLEKSMILLTAELKKKITFTSFEELIKVLNTYLIPEWIYCGCDDLFKYLPEIYQIDDMLYFMNKDNNKHSFRSIAIEYIKNINEDCTNDLDKEGYCIISNRYSEILGCNKTLGIIYLSPAHMHSEHTEYHLYSQQEVIKHEKCLGLVGNTVIIEKDGFIMARVGEKLHRIWKISVLEKYEIENNEIYVTPQYGEPGVFKPFRLGMGGKKIEVSYLEASNYLLEQMDAALSFIMKIFCECKGDRGENADKKKELFTLDALHNHYKEVNQRENNERTRVYQFIVELLSKYIEQNVDVLDIFYILLDASRRYEKDYWGGSISEKVYWRMVELDETGELKNAISDLSLFKRKVLEDVYWTDERIKEKEKMSCDCGCIGSFSFNKEKLVSDVETVENGYLIGSSMFISPNGNEGIVSYNIETGEFQVQYPRLMSLNEIKKVVEKFDLENRSYRIVIKDKNSQSVN